MSRNGCPVVDVSGRGRLAAVIALLALAVPAAADLPRTQAPGARRIAVIAVDPDLRDVQFYLNSPRIAQEMSWYKENGYELASVPGTVDGVMSALLNREVRALTFVGEGGARTTAGQPLSSLAQLDAAGWRRSYQMAMVQKLRREGMGIDEAMKRATKESENFNLERVVNYSCYSLADTSIAELFVRPGGIYYGSSTLYSANPLSVVHFWFFDEMQFFLEPYTVPGVTRPAVVQSFRPGAPPPGYEGCGCFSSDGRNGTCRGNGCAEPPNFSGTCYWQCRDAAGNTVRFRGRDGAVMK